MRSPAPVSYLFVPATRPERFDKALAAGADRVIIDLEDAVAPDDKNSAREALAAWLSKDVSVAIRINSADTSWFSDDLVLCAREGGTRLGGTLWPDHSACQVASRWSA